MKHWLSFFKSGEQYSGLWAEWWAELLSELWGMVDRIVVVIDFICVFC